MHHRTSLLSPSVSPFYKDIDITQRFLDLQNSIKTEQSRTRTCLFYLWLNEMEEDWYIIFLSCHPTCDIEEVKTRQHIRGFLKQIWRIQSKSRCYQRLLLWRIVVLLSSCDFDNRCYTSYHFFLHFISPFWRFHIRPKFLIGEEIFCTSFNGILFLMTHSKFYLLCIILHAENNTFLFFK